MSLGNFLIKRVAQALEAELPQLKTFARCHRSRALWRGSPAAGALVYDGLPATLKRLNAAHDTLSAATAADYHQLWATAIFISGIDDATRAKRCWPWRAYLIHESPRSGGDPVARFHLDNGARAHQAAERAGGLSAKGLRQSAGLMVNYLYNLDRVEQSHEDFVNGTVTHARAVSSLL